MELRHLRYFMAVAEELHFGRAAARLYMAQPPLSQQIRQLENEIGVLLFERTNRRVQLTEAGQVFFTDARAILERVDTAVERAQQAARGEAGWLGIGFVASAAYGILPDILRQFREQYPGVELTLEELHGGEQGEALREHRIHVGFTRLPADEEGVILECVVREPLLVALPTSHRLAPQETVPLTALEREPFIQFPPEPQSHYATFVTRLCQEAGFTPNVVQKTGELATTVSLVAAGIGVAIVPGSVENLHRDGVVYRTITTRTPTGQTPPIIELTMAYRANDSSPVLPHFLEIARQSIRTEK